VTRRSLHLGVDVLLAAVAIGLTTTGLLMAFTLPPGSHGSTLLGLSRHEWGDVHFWLAMVILAGGLVHLTLNWGWVCAAVTKAVAPHRAPPGPAARRSIGLGLLAAVVVVLGVLGYAAQQAVVSDPNPQPGRDDAERLHRHRDAAAAVAPDAAPRTPRTPFTTEAQSS